MASESLAHVFLVSFTAQSHVKALLRFGKRIASKGLLVTFAAPETVDKHLRNASNVTNEPTPVGDGLIRFEFFEDGWDEKEPRRIFLDQYLPQLDLVGKKVIPQLIKQNAEQGKAVSCLIYNPFIPWVADVAESLGLPSAMLWIQSCACFETYYHYYHGPMPFPSEENPEIDVQLPFMPLLKYDEIPSFLLPTSRFASFRGEILCQYRNIEKPSYILMDTFQDLEADVINYMSKFFHIKPVGPLFKNSKEPDAAVKGDLVEVDDCLEWLNSKPSASVVYISFGSIVSLKADQIEEIAYGLLNTGVCFLWVMKPNERVPDGFLAKAGDKGKIVQWSPQEEVLAHSAITCFVTHCGWNSSMEALTSGVPVIAFPQWGDQVTNAKFWVDVYEVGVRMCRGEAENRLITRDEVERCLLEATVRPNAAEMKKNTMKWKTAAEAAVAEGGSSDRNIQDFVDEVRRRSVEILSNNRSIEHLTTEEVDLFQK